MFDCATMKTFALPLLYSTDLPPIRPGNTPGRDPLAICLGRDPGGLEKRAPAVAEVCWRAQARTVRKERGAAFLQIVVTATFL
jgi:hypothetical protein